MKTFLVLPIVALLTACATSFTTLNRALPLLQGQSISVAMGYLGIPDREYEIAGRKVYVWGTSEINPFPTAVTTTTDGTAGNRTFKATSTTYVSDPSPLSCKIKMMAYGDVVQSFEYDGNNGTCFKYADRLRPLLNNSK